MPTVEIDAEHAVKLYRLAVLTEDRTTEEQEAIEHLLARLPDDYGTCSICGERMLSDDELHSSDDGADIHEECCYLAGPCAPNSSKVS